MIYSVYILQSVTSGRYYIGSTSLDVPKRLARHNAGHVKSTKPYRPYEIIYVEQYTSRAQAIHREMHIKKYRSGNALQKLVQEK